MFYIINNITCTRCRDYSPLILISSVYLISVYLISVYLISVYLISVYLISVYLISVYLISVYLISVYSSLSGCLHTWSHHKSNAYFLCVYPVYIYRPYIWRWHNLQSRSKLLLQILRLISRLIVFHTFFNLWLYDDVII